MTAWDSLVEVVALSLFLDRKRFRRALLESPADVAGDQRRGVDMEDAAARFRELPAHLRAEGRRCRERAVRLLEVGAAGGIEAIGWSDSRYPERDSRRSMTGLPSSGSRGTRRRWPGRLRLRRRRQRLPSKRRPRLRRTRQFSARRWSEPPT